MFVIACVSRITFIWQTLFKAYSEGGTLQGVALEVHSSDLPPREPAAQREHGRQPSAAASSDLLWCSHQVHGLPGTPPSM